MFQFYCLQTCNQCDRWQFMWDTYLCSIWCLVGGDFWSWVTQRKATNGFSDDMKVTSELHQFVVNAYLYNDVYSCSYSFNSNRPNRHEKADGKNSCHAEAYSFSSASVPGSWSGDSQLWRPCEKLKGNFSCPANLTPLLRMNQKRNTLFEQKESERKQEGKREWTKKWNQLFGSASSLRRYSSACS